MILTGKCLIMTGGFSVAHLYVDEILSNFSGRGGDRQIQCSMCGRVYKKLPIVNIFSSIYAIINVSMSHTHPSCFVSKVTCCLSD